MRRLRSKRVSDKAGKFSGIAFIGLDPIPAFCGNQRRGNNINLVANTFEVPGQGEP